MAGKLAIFTEAEAAKRWCHRVVGIGDSGCVGPRCMAWRWFETHIHDPQGGPDLVPNGETYGYCGLAGSPAITRESYRG